MTRGVGFIVTLALVVISSSAKSQLIQPTLGEGIFYQQTNNGVTSASGYSIEPYAFMQSASNFTGGSLTGPAGPDIPMTLANHNTTEFLPATVFPQGFSTLAALNAVFPFGTYQLNASNNVTLKTESANINYTQNFLSNVPPQLTPASYAGLQNLSAGSAFDLQFNSFAPSPNATSSFTDVDITTLSGATVFSSNGSLAPSTTNVVLPAGTLAAGTKYNLTLGFIQTAFKLEAPTGTFPNLQTVNAGIYAATDTGITFTTAAGPKPPQTLINLPGGLLPPGPVGSVSSAIGGNGASVFYGFYWNGGTIDAIASVAGANANGSYEYELLNPGGSVITDLTLDAADGFSATMDEVLQAGGLYEIGLVADSSFDPEFTIDFATPVDGASAPLPTPEPPTGLLLVPALFALFIIGRRRQVAG